MRERGIVAWFNNTRGYGFIKRDSRSDIFVHYTQIKQQGYKTLNEGDHVEFSVGPGPKGQQANDVEVIDA